MNQQNPSMDKKDNSPAKQRRDPQSLLPVTIAQINSCQAGPDSKFRIDGKEVSQMTFVAEILATELKETYLDLTLNDGTGTLVCKFYIDNEEDISKRGDIKESTYTRVVGHVRSQAAGAQREKFVIAFQLIPLKDPNEITFHMLDTVWTHLLNTGKATPAVQGGSNASSATAAAAAAPAAAAPTHNPLQEAILKIFNAADPANEAGLEISAVVSQLHNICTKQDVEREVVALANDGRLYSTKDEFHYKSTDLG